jgi:hypothetical protein
MTSFPKLAITLLFVSSIAFAQTPTPIKNLYALGSSYNVNAKPSVAGTALYAHYIAAPGTYAFTAIDVLPNTVKPFTVTSNIGAGLAQKMFTIGRASLFMPTTAGISWTGANTGWQWSGGAAVVVSTKYGFYLIPTVRFLKSSVSGGTGYQPIVGLALGFGK